MSQKRGFLFENLEKTPPSLILLGMIGVMLIPTSAAVISTISIVLLSLLLISCLKNETLIFQIFSNKNVVHLGLLSYSLYLWHWSILSISKLTIGIHFWTLPLQIGLIYFFAKTSYKWIEAPLRNKKWSGNNSKTIFKGTLALTISAPILVGLESPLGRKLYLGNLNLEVKKPYFESFKINRNCYLTSFKKAYSYQKISKECLEKNNKEGRTLLFTGDSHSYSFWLGSEFITKQTNSNLFSFSYGGVTFPSVKYFLINFKEKRLKAHEIMQSFEKKVSNELRENDIVFITMVASSFWRRLV